MLVPLRPDERWSLDFVSDQLADGHRFRILAIVDDCTRECLALVADNGSEFTSNAILTWADQNRVEWHYIAPGSVSRDIACNVDFAPTFLDYAGLPVPSYMQGRSMRPVLEKRTPADWEQLTYHRYWMHNDEIHECWAHYGVRDTRYKLIYWYNDDLGQLGARPNGAPPEWELFDCDKDPHELTNVAADPAYAGIFKDMLAKLDAKMAEIGDVPEHDSVAVLAGLAA
ncbi:MAG: hypothetical protein ABS76_12145 [Pelagibacterium sp. SCN 64-44]|nr:MAG: hypothetical protein ABS76_12145 [Pelagibacterium sp. SCN 64-44]